MARPRGELPAVSVPCTAPVLGCSLSTRPEPCSETKAEVPSGLNTTPKGREPRPVGTVCTTAPVLGSSTLMLPEPWLVTQMRPSGACASVCGFRPTACSKRRVLLAALMAVTESLSELTTHTRLRPASKAIVLDARGAVAVGCVCTVCVAEQVPVTVPLRTVSTTG